MTAIIAALLMLTSGHVTVYQHQQLTIPSQRICYGTAFGPHCDVLLTNDDLRLEVWELRGTKDYLDNAGWASGRPHCDLGALFPDLAQQAQQHPEWSASECYAGGYGPDNAPLHDGLTIAEGAQP